MYTAIVLLSLGMAIAVASSSLADHADLITNRNLAAVRAERAASEFIDGCGSRGCDPRSVNATRHDGTVLSGCLSQTAGTQVLRVEARISWTPIVFTGSTPATGIVAIKLGGFASPAAAVLKRC